MWSGLVANRGELDVWHVIEEVFVTTRYGCSSAGNETLLVQKKTGRE